MFDIFMIGRAQATARPYIMFSCKHRKSREKAVAVIKESNILDQYPGINISDWDYPPHLKNLRQLALSAVGSDTLLDRVQIEKEIDPYNWRAYPVVDRKSGKVRTLQLATRNEPVKNGYPCLATIGSVIELEGKQYYVVPSHIFNSTAAEVTVEEDISSEDSECGLDDSDFDDETLSDAQDEADFMSQYSASPGTSDIEEDWDLDDGNTISDGESIQGLDEKSEQLQSIMMINSDEASTTFNDAELALVGDHAFSMTAFPRLGSQSLDYCLIEIEEGDNVSNDLPILSRDTIGHPDRKCVNVTVFTGLGNVLRGVISSQRSCIRLPGATKYISVLSVQFEGSLQPGNCGSIVRDAITNKIYGHLVAGDTESQFAFIVPAGDVLDDVMTKKLELEASSAGASQLPFVGSVNESNQKSPSIVPRQVSNFIGYSSTPDTSFDEIMDSDQTAVTGTLHGGFYASNICEPCADAIVNHAVEEPGDVAPTPQTLHLPCTVEIEYNTDEAGDRTYKLIRFLTELSLPRDLDDEMQDLDLSWEQKSIPSADLDLPFGSPQRNQTSPHTDGSDDPQTRLVALDFFMPNPSPLHDAWMDYSGLFDIDLLPSIDNAARLSPYDMWFTGDTERTSSDFSWADDCFLDTTVNFDLASHARFDADNPNNAQKGADSLSLANGILGRTKSPWLCEHCRPDRPVHRHVFKRHIDGKHYLGFEHRCYYDDCGNRCSCYFPRRLNKIMWHYRRSKTQQYSSSGEITYSFNDGDPCSAKGIDCLPTHVAGLYPDSVSHIIPGVSFSKRRAGTFFSIHSWSASRSNERRPWHLHPELYEWLSEHCIRAAYYVKHEFSTLISRDTGASASPPHLRKAPLYFLFIPPFCTLDCMVQPTTTDQGGDSNWVLVLEKDIDVQASITRRTDKSAATQGGGSHGVQSSCNAGVSSLYVPVSTMKTHSYFFERPNGPKMDSNQF